MCKMLEGFKIFYEYKKEVGIIVFNVGSVVDIDNFFDFIGYMIKFNELLIDFLW